VFTAWKGYDGFSAKVRASIRQFKDYGGHIVWGPAAKSEPLVKTGGKYRKIFTYIKYHLDADFRAPRSKALEKITPKFIDAWWPVV
jgi:hypothetical protein